MRRRLNKPRSFGKARQSARLGHAKAEIFRHVHAPEGTPAAPVPSASASRSR